MSSTATRTGVTTYSTPSDLEIQMVRIVRAPRELVFQAHTRPEHLRHWMLGPEGWSMSVCDIDLRPGGRQRFVWTRTDGSEMEITGEIREVTSPERFVTTESWGEDWAETINTTVLTEDGEHTVITTTLRYPSKDARDAAMQTGMNDGMEASYARLDAYLAAATA